MNNSVPEEDLRSQIIDRIITYVEFIRIKTFGGVSLSDSSEAVKIRDLFVQDGYVDEETIKFFSHSMLNLKKRWPKALRSNAI